MRQSFLYFLIILCIGIHSCAKKTLSPASSTEELHILLGNPSKATADPANSENFLVIRPQYALSYNSARGTANWVSWHLNATWKGTVKRQDNFRPDHTLPDSWYRATPGDYTNTGFDRGHLCPSDDRDKSEEDNQATFLMSNIVPQAPNNNRTTWRNLEEYCRTLIDRGNELYIVAGVYGRGGSGSNGGTTNTLASGKITVPARFYKIIVILPEGDKDVSRISSSTRVIAVDMPNKQAVDEQPWSEYRVSVDDIEKATGYDFLSNLPAALQQSLEAKPDTEPVRAE
ncbi:DNA/RNA non-specific endonuclease [Rhodocytophaga aerolata]|uniref:DNA/RNA non-specific endonuclease n=1 Tax=Rhodocytophaga aerolata TaxID=455078 RepID=A0ABT8R9B7_9BACT|nr:DNA/RNA non-specific endonuclease [Rhodocytophaga aerolata]MDO1447954.1 DNA/RNA non-specific endonuclease [Rhodocytophaga aerolata]